MNWPFCDESHPLCHYLSDASAFLLSAIAEQSSEAGSSACSSCLGSGGPQSAISRGWNSASAFASCSFNKRLNFCCVIRSVLHTRLALDVD